MFRSGVFVAVLIACSILSWPAQAARGYVLGINPPGHCAEDGCSYLDGKGRCLLSADGEGGMHIVVNGSALKLKRLEQRPVFRRNMRIPNQPGNKMLSRYETVESAVGHVQVQILDTVVRTHGKCRHERDGCEAVDYKSRIQVQFPRKSLTIAGRGWCND
jgi:hypothetical protein